MLFPAAFYLWNATKSILPQVREKLIVGGLMNGGVFDVACAASQWCFHSCTSSTAVRLSLVIWDLLKIKLTCVKALCFLQGEETFGT